MIIDSNKLRKNFNLKGVELKNFVFLNKTESEKVRERRNSPDISKWMYHDHIIEKEEHAAFVEKLKEDDRNFYWVVQTKELGDLGVVYLNEVDLTNKEAFLGIYANLINKHKGKGLVLLNSICDLVFTKLNVDCLKLELFKENNKAYSLYKKYGFTIENILKNSVYKNNRKKNIIRMKITKDEWGK